MAKIEKVIQCKGQCKVQWGLGVQGGKKDPRIWSQVQDMNLL